MKQLILIAAFTAVVFSAHAQNKLQGRVMDASANIPLFGATISVGGKAVSTTDKEGKFSLDCTRPLKITISFVGYQTQQHNIKNCSENVQVYLVPLSHALDAVEITTVSGENKSLLHQPASISKLTLLELKRGQGIFLDDAIQTSVPGVIMNRRSVSGGQQFNIRGYGNGTRGTRGISSNFDGQGYKVYLNGVPVTDAEGITTLDDIDYASLGNVEFVKGPAGTLYGQAIAGAINFKTIMPEKGKTSIGQDVMFGNYNLQRYTTHFQMGSERNSILLNYGKQKSDGFSIHNKSHKDFVNFALDFTGNEKQNINTYLGFTDSYDERMGELTLTQYQNKDYSGNIEYIKRNAHSHVITFRAGLTHAYNFSKKLANTTSIFGTGFRSDVSSAGGWTDKTTVNYGFRTSFNTKFFIANGITLTGVAGAEVQKQNAQVVGYNMKQNPKDTTTNGWSWGKPYWVINATTSNTAFVTAPVVLFTEWNLALPQNLSLTAGIGISTQKITLDDRLNAATATNPSHFDTTYKKMVSPHVAINKVFSQGFSVYASYSVGYKAPVSSYFFIVTPATTSPAVPATGRVNGALKPEKGSQFELGSKGELFENRLMYQLAFFTTKYKDKMTSVAVPLNNTATAYSYVVNGGEQNHKGVEASVRYSVIKNSGLFSYVTPFINFTYSDFTYGDNFIYVTGSTVANRDTFNYSGLDVFGVPKIMSSQGVDVAMNNGLYGNISHLYKDGVNIAIEKTSNSPKIFMLRKSGSYNLLNGKVGYRRALSSHIDIDAFFGVNNITGVQYPMMIFINQLPDAYIPAPPKAGVYGGLNVKYNF
ncbi:MAG: TonB-dependent receptor [Chitinophagaceae bacterium]